MREGANGKEDKEICNARNLASGSIRLLNPAACRKRHVYFYSFNINVAMLHGDLPSATNLQHASFCCRVFDEKLVLIMFCVENGCFGEYNV